MRKSEEKLRIGVVVGEASGDFLGAGLIKELQKKHPMLIVEGIAGPKMQALGAKSLFPMERLSVMGFLEPLLRLPELLRIRKKLREHFIKNPPDVFIGIDSPDFNLDLELKLKKAGIKTVHYVSPSVWMWRQNRIYKIKKACDLMLTIFPFAQDFYIKNNMPAKFVGHPLADEIPLKIDVNAAREELRLDVTKKYLAILPGSRESEIKYLAKSFIMAAKICREKIQDLEIITAMISEERKNQLLAIINSVAPNLNVKIFIAKSHEVMAAADVILLCAGTATLEAALMKKPMVVAYKTSWLSYRIWKMLIKIKFIALPNLIAGKEIVAEMFQKETDAENLYLKLKRCFDDTEYVNFLHKTFSRMHAELKQNASFGAASAIENLLN